MPLECFENILFVCVSVILRNEIFLLPCIFVGELHRKVISCDYQIDIGLRLRLRQARRQTNLPFAGMVIIWRFYMQACLGRLRS